MKSLRLRLALISMAISGAVIAAFGVGGWMLTARLLQEAIDLRMATPLDRIILDLHPRTDLDRVISNLEIGFGDEVEEGRQLILILDRDGSELYRAPEEKWVEELDPDLLPERRAVPASELIRPRGEGGAAGSPGPGEGRPPPREGGRASGPPEWERRFEEEMRAAGLVPENGDMPGPGEGRPESRQGDGAGPAPPRNNRSPKGRPGDEKGPGPSGLSRSGPPKASFQTLHLSGKQWRVGIEEDRGYVVLMATELSGYRSEIGQVRKLFFLAYPACLLVIGIGGWFVARRALRPVDLIASTASRVTAHGLDQRIPNGVHDYEELSHLVDVLNGMMDRLQESFRYAMRFSADVSHELKTPLAVLQATVQDALKECTAGTKEEESLLAVNQEAERLKRITRSLMLLAQADSGQLAVRKESFSLSAEVEAICEDAEILCGKADLTLEAEIEPDLVVESDPTLLRQAMQNLVSNAVKYNCPEGRVRCRLYRFEDSSEIVFEIANTGPGIDEEEQAKVFERFYRVDRARSREVDGFGLGLNLAWEIVNAMGGELRLVESNEDITRFQLRLKEFDRASKKGEA